MVQRDPNFRFEKHSNLDKRPKLQRKIVYSKKKKRKDKKANERKGPTKLVNEQKNLDSKTNMAGNKSTGSLLKNIDEMEHSSLYEGDLVNGKIEHTEDNSKVQRHMKNPRFK